MEFFEDPSMAFSRNLGWLTSAEQAKISSVHVGIIGLGGVGGQYAEVLARLGVQKFTLYDADTFSIENTNRQNECKVQNYGKNKASVIAKLITDINPHAVVNAFSKNLTTSEIDGFCNSIDIYLDSLDFFEIDLRIALFKKMRALKKPAITAAPIGTGVARVTFTHDSMSFDDYFGLHTTTDFIERAHLFLVGVAPSLQQKAYIQDRKRVDLKNHKVPSLPNGVYSCASAVATEFMKIVLERGPRLVAPWSIHYDPYLLKIKKSYVFWGYRNPIQKLKVFIMKRMLENRSHQL